MKKAGLYENAHLFLAAVRIFEHRNSSVPSVEDICREISFSSEEGHRICRKLEELGVVNVVEGAYGARISIRNHLIIEEIPRDDDQDSLLEELEKFQSSRKELTEKIENIQADQDKKKKDLFAELDRQIKKGLTDKP